jgi:hypothetical protein
MKRLALLLVLFAVVFLIATDDYYTNNPRFWIVNPAQNDIVSWDSTMKAYVTLDTLDVGRIITPYSHNYIVDSGGHADYTTIQEALDVINADAVVHATANDYASARYILKITPGLYTENISIGSIKYLRIEMAGVKINGTVAIATVRQGGTADNYYSKVEFWGGMSPYAEKGENGEISGNITCTRDGDSLMYLSFSGMEVANSLLFTTGGTWVVLLNDTYFSNASAWISGEFNTGANPCALLVTRGQSQIDASIAEVTTSGVTTVALYDCMDTQFKMINIDMAYGGILRNCTFTGAVTIASGTYEIDNFSWGEITRQTENLTGATVTYMDNLNGGNVTIVGDLTAQDDIALTDSLWVGDDVVINDSLFVGGMATITDTLFVTSIRYTTRADERLIQIDSDGNIEATDLNSWVSGTANEVLIADDADGTITASLPDTVVIQALNIGTVATPQTIAMTDSYIPAIANVASATNPSSQYTLAGAYFKASAITLDQTNTQIAGLLSRASMGKNVLDAYGLQSHLTISNGANSTGNMTAVSGKTILRGNNSTGIVTAGLFTLEGQNAAGDASELRSPNNAYGLWVDIVDVTTPAGIEVHANGSGVQSGIKFDKTGIGAFVNEITGQNAENINNATNGTWDFGSAILNTSGGIAGATLNTGQGAYELHAMNQDVQTSDNVTFNNMILDSLYVGAVSVDTLYGHSPITVLDDMEITGKVQATTYGSTGAVTDAELLYISELTSDVQAQINGIDTYVSQDTVSAYITKSLKPFELRKTTLNHGMTTLGATTAYGHFTIGDATDGGLSIRGLVNDDDNCGLDLGVGMVGGTPTEYPMKFHVGQKVSTTWSPFTGEQLAFGWFNNTQEIMTLNTTAQLSLGTDLTYHQVSIYDSDPSLCLTDTGLNLEITSIATAQDTNAVWLDCDDTTPEIGMSGSDGDSWDMSIDTDDHAKFENATVYDFDNKVVANGDVSGTSVTTNNYVLDVTPTPATADSCSGFRTTLTFGDTIAQWDALYMNADGELYRADADTVISMPVMAMAVASGTNAQSKEVILQGTVYNTDWNWTIGGLIYASGTLGGITQTAPVGDNDVVQIVGIAISADAIYFNPNYVTIVLTVP